MIRENKFLSYLPEMRDPRIERTKRHLFDDIVFIAIASVLSGGDSWNDMEEDFWANLVFVAKENCGNGVEGGVKYSAAVAQMLNKKIDTFETQSKKPNNMNRNFHKKVSLLIRNIVNQILNAFD